MTETKGIKNLKEVVDFGFAVSTSGVELLEGGKFHPEKLGVLLTIIPTVGPAFEDLGEVVPELKDLSAEEVAELTAHILTKGVIPANAAAILEKSLKVAGAAWELVLVIKGA